MGLIHLSKMKVSLPQLHLITLTMVLHWSSGYTSLEATFSYNAISKYLLINFNENISVAHES